MTYSCYDNSTLKSTSRAGGCNALPPIYTTNSCAWHVPDVRGTCRVCANWARWIVAHKSLITLRFDSYYLPCCTGEGCISYLDRLTKCRICQRRSQTRRIGRVSGVKYHGADHPALWRPQLGCKPVNNMSMILRGKFCMISWYFLAQVIV